MAARSPWIGTSWKMNKTRAEARQFAEAVKDSRIAESAAARLFLVPPFTAIESVATILAGEKIRIGAQNIHWADSGAWTGEISLAMIKDVGATLVEIGHSERRRHFGETDETVAKKVEAAVRHGLVALVCIGDTREEYEAGRTGEALARQTRAALSRIEKGRASQVVIAYEPVWSIGEGGTPANPAFADRQHALIKNEALRLCGAALDVIYGGSVSLGNCRALAAQPNIDGLFIGRAAWRAEGYIEIVRAVTEHLAEK
ncbi:MAG TPA: triose-phosphate isomerase [Roseiarcus sp.]|nr:triose-phosphate isomerase [Roseiarcus sp.]